MTDATQDRAAAFERIVEITPAFDRRDPSPSKNYGIHSAELKMVIKGSLGAVQFVLYTGWHLPHVDEELEASGRGRDILRKPLPADLGYHSPTPLYDDQTCITQECPYLDGAPCYYDGSGLNADRIFRVLVSEGSDGVWRELEDYYAELFVAKVTA